jgi:uncharacterized protein
VGNCLRIERVPAAVVAAVYGAFAPVTQTGILAAVLTPLAQAQVGILAVSTFDTDSVLVKETNLGRAQDALVAAGHVILTVTAAI